MTLFGVGMDFLWNNTLIGNSDVLPMLIMNFQAQVSNCQFGWPHRLGELLVLQVPRPDGPTTQLNLEKKEGEDEPKLILCNSNCFH